MNLNPYQSVKVKHNSRVALAGGNSSMMTTNASKHKDGSHSPDRMSSLHTSASQYHAHSRPVTAGRRIQTAKLNKGNFYSNANTTISQSFTASRGGHRGVSGRP